MPVMIAIHMPPATGLAYCSELRIRVIITLRAEECHASPCASARLMGMEEKRPPSWPIYLGLVLGIIIGAEVVYAFVLPFLDRRSERAVPVIAMGGVFGAMAGCIIADYLRAQRYREQRHRSKPDPPEPRP